MRMPDVFKVFYCKRGERMTELKPCPFCGSSSVEIMIDEFTPPGKEWWMIVCNKCAAEYRSAFYRKKDVIERWNMRVNE